MGGGEMGRERERKRRTHRQTNKQTVSSHRSPPISVCLGWLLLIASRPHLLIIRRGIVDKDFIGRGKRGEMGIGGSCCGRAAENKEGKEKGRVIVGWKIGR